MSDINKKIEKAFDDASWNSNLVHLNEKQANKFIDYVADESVIMKSARVVRMTNPIENIAKINIWDDIWNVATRWVEMDTAKRVKASTSNIQLVSKEIISEVQILDDELQDNIEWSAFTAHLLQMIAKKWANQLEWAFTYWNALSNTLNAVNINWLFDWFITKAESEWVVVDASDTWLFSDRYIERAKLTKLYKSFPTKYRKSLDWIFTPSDIAIDYEDLYNTNTTTSQWAVNRNRFHWVAFTEAPLMSIERPVETWTTTTMDDNATAWTSVIPVTATTDFTVWQWIVIVNADNWQTETHTIASVQSWISITIDWTLAYDQVSWSEVKEAQLDWTDVLVTNKKNLIIWFQKNITIEKDRKPRLRWTVFVMTARIDCQVENTEALWLLTKLAVK